MFKKYLVLSIIVLVFNSVGVRLVFSQTQNEKSAKTIQKIKDEVTKIGVGEKSKVRVELLNKTKIKGYISAIDGDSFTITDKKTGATTKIEFTQTKKVKRGYGTSTAVTIAVVAGVAATAAILLTLLRIRCNNEGC
ncbi:MAG TPA: hypothetical protein PKE69_18530 [Pyrinomonadaceae bacterium]|nr:hypothetical protein [Pyrinomonadaceae bacterium]